MIEKYDFQCHYIEVLFLQPSKFVIFIVIEFSASNDYLLYHFVRYIKMLGDKNLTVNIAAKDLSIAKKFYEEILGLKQVGTEGLSSIMFRSGTTDLLIYQ